MQTHGKPSHTRVSLELSVVWMPVRYSEELNSKQLHLRLFWKRPGLLLGSRGEIPWGCILGLVWNLCVGPWECLLLIGNPGVGLLLQSHFLQCKEGQPGLWRRGLCSLWIPISNDNGALCSSNYRDVQRPQQVRDSFLTCWGIVCVSWLIESRRKALPSPKGRTSSTGFKSLSRHRLQEAVGVLSHMFLKRRQRPEIGTSVPTGKELLPFSIKTNGII